MISIAIDNRWWLGIGLIVLIAACTSSSKPSIKLSATPTSLEDGQILTLKAEATGGQGSKVEFYRVQGTTNGEKVGEDATAPFELILPIVSNDDATLAFTAKVIGADGQTGISEAVSVNVKVDKEAPKIGLAASRSNLNAAGAVTLTANATDNKGVVKVEFFKDAEKLGEDTTAADGFSLVVNLSAEDNGSLKYTAKAHDKKGNVGTSAEVSVTVEIDISAPSIALSSNKTKVIAVGSVTLTADALDNKAVIKVEFYEGANKLAEDTEAPFTHQISFTAANNGNHSYTAKAFDAAGNSAVSGEVAIAVDIDATLPVVSLTSDQTSITKAGSALLTAEASDDKGISKVGFYHDSVLLGEDTEAPYNYTLNFTDTDNGIYSYTSKAYDSNGNIATSDPVSISVDIDVVAPQVSLSANPTSLDAVGTITLTATASDNKGISRVEFYKGTTLLGTDTDGSDGYKQTIVYNASYSASDSFTAKAFDPSGNQASSDTIGVPIDIDITAPTVSLSTSTSLLTSPDTIIFTATSSDNVAVTKLEFYSATPGGDVLIDTIHNPAASKEISLTVDAEANGTLTYHAKAYDAKNNASTSTASVVVAIKPTITKFEAALGSSLTLSDAGGTVDLVWAGENVQSYLLVPSGSLVVTVPIPGQTGNTSGRLFIPANATNQAKTYTVTLNAKAYGSGIQGATQTLTITVAADTTPPVIASFTASNTNVTVASTITLAASATDASGIAKVEFYESGNATPIATISNAPYQHSISYSAVNYGTHTYTAKAYDKNGNSAESGAVSVEVKIFGWSELTSGGFHTCAVDLGNKTYCWGRNLEGQLGNGTTTTALVPSAATLPGGVTLGKLVAGDTHSCALDTNGQAYCWGNNNDAQLGIGLSGTANNKYIPTAVLMPSGVSFSKLVAGVYHTCALDMSGNAYCWGPYSSNTGKVSIPTQIAMPSGVKFSQLSAGFAHTCGLDMNGQAYCWGNNTEGQLGNGTNTGSNAPTAVTLPQGITFSQLEAKGNHTCALGSDSQAYCWGRNAYGQLGNGSSGTGTNKNLPTQVTLPAGVTFTQLAAGAELTCGLDINGKAYCWGRNNSGQLGNGSSTDSAIPTPVTLPSGIKFVQLSVTNDHTCAVGSDGQAYCWGRNSYGQLGDGTLNHRNTPVLVKQP